MYKIADYIQVLDTQKYFELSYRKIWRINKTLESQRIISKLCTTGLDEKEAIDNKLFKLLKDSKLIHQVHDETIGINSRTEYYFENIFINATKALKKLMNKKVCIIGLGGLGTQILQYLCGMNIKNYLLIDYDAVEASNLNRQFLYSYEDIGKYKTDICSKYIKSHVSGTCNIVTAVEKIETSDQLTKVISKFIPSIIVCVADQPQGKIIPLVKAVAKKLNIPLITGGVGPDFASYSFSNKVEQHKEIDDKNILHARQVTYGSFGPTNGCISAMIAHDTIMKLINGPCWLKGQKEIAIDFKDLTIHRM